MSSHAEVHFPQILWAQRPDCVLLTLPLPDATGVCVEILHDGSLLSLSAAAGDPPRAYSCRLPLFRPVASEESRHVTLPRQIELRLQKKPPPDDADAEEVRVGRNWPRLSRERRSGHLIQVDWTRWKDAEEEEEGNGNLFGGEMEDGDLMSQFMMQQAQRGEMGNGAEGKREEDLEDFEDLPPLEE